MAYSDKFTAMAEAARTRVSSVQAHEVDVLLAEGAVALDIRDKEEHDIDHIAGSQHISRGKLEMNVEEQIPNLDTPIITYCNVNYRGALSADSLQAMGYSNTRYIEGGLKAYRALQNK
ncbi:MAG: rhodanese-like domain-containing protein [Methylococcales bacterium]|nr:rhodanese-like domain-containing protein [Methylococcales bacterium]